MYTLSGTFGEVIAFLEGYYSERALLQLSDWLQRFHRAVPEH
jgi:hypothetical protein